MKEFIHENPDRVTSEEYHEFRVIAYITLPGKASVAILRQARTCNNLYGFSNLYHILNRPRGCDKSAKGIPLHFKATSPQGAIESALTHGRIVYGFESTEEFMKWASSNMKAYSEDCDEDLSI